MRRVETDRPTVPVAFEISTVSLQPVCEGEIETYIHRHSEAGEPLYCTVIHTEATAKAY